jgi:hypothetical protein
MLYFSIAWIGLIHLLVYVLIVRKPKTTFVIYLICIYLLVYKVSEYGYFLIVERVYNKIPVDYSAITYFLLPLVFLLKRRRLLPWATFSAFISGFGYLATFGFLARKMIEYNGYYSVVMALINHSVLYVASILIMQEHLFEKRTGKIVISGSVAMVAYAALVYFFVDFGQKYIFIYKLLDGTYAAYLFKDFHEFSLSYLIYYLFLFGAFAGVVRLFYKINEIIYRTNAEKRMRFDNIGENNV